MAKGLAGSIPQLFSNLAIQFLRQLNTQGDRVQYLEYVRPGWTYHCKGIHQIVHQLLVHSLVGVWYYIEGENLPILTLIGSSNYGNDNLLSVWVYKFLHRMSVIDKRFGSAGCHGDTEQEIAMCFRQCKLLLLKQLQSCFCFAGEKVGF